MAASSVLDTLQDLAAKEVDAAAEQLAAANRQVQEAQQQLQLLQNYRKEYLDKLLRQLTAGLDIQTHQNFQRFMRMLDQAVAGQETLLQAAQAQAARALEQWRQSQRKKLSYEVLSDRSQKRAQRVELKQEQKLMDEFAMRSRKFI